MPRGKPPEGGVPFAELAGRNKEIREQAERKLAELRDLRRGAAAGAIRGVEKKDAGRAFGELAQLDGLMEELVSHHTEVAPDNRTIAELQKRAKALGSSYGLPSETYDVDAFVKLLKQKGKYTEGGF